MAHQITLANLLPAHKRNRLNHLLVKILDALLGIRKMNKLYQQHEMAGLTKEQFAIKLLEILNIELLGTNQFTSRVPTTGPLVVASNHPFGGIEGVILSLLLGTLRPDLKVLANQGLKLFPELDEYFIYTNPLSENDPKNTPSIRASLRHVKQGGALLVFPAGRVAYYQSNKQRISEHQWNRLVGRLASVSGSQFLPVFVNGQNSRLFYRLGRIYYRLRLLMLGRELLNKQNLSVQLTCGYPVPAKAYAKECDADTLAALCRAQSYCQTPQWRQDWPADTKLDFKPIAAEASRQVLDLEISSLPAEQCLVQQKQYRVYYAMQHQAPSVVKEIARLRESVFREHNEGSGEPLDTDKFDATYTHLFVQNTDNGKIIGAYRMGRTDELLKQGGLEHLYLSRMFAFSQQFVNRQEPCLEMGRSFLIPEYQRSFQGLFLLWRGIGAFVCKYPQYRTLYGTVSLSKLYDMRSVALIEKALITPTDKVRPYTPFDFPLHPELADFADSHDLNPHLKALLASIEPDGKDIPILAKHYQKLGAKFHCLGIDKHFNHTPGLLLSVDLTQAPHKLLKLYLGESYPAYLSYKG